MDPEIFKAYDIRGIYEEQFDLPDSLFQNTLILRFRKLLDQNIGHKHKVADYCDLLKVSKSHLNKELQASFGKSCLSKQRRWSYWPKTRLWKCFTSPGLLVCLPWC